MDPLLRLTILSFRLSNAILCKTSFDPDEYWQSLEVAHRRAFGYGYLTWEWHIQLRSFLFPLPFKCLFRVLAVFDGYPFSRFLLVLCPRLLMALLAHLTDVYSFRICHLLFGRATGLVCLYLQITSWFIFYSITRTFVNCVETFLVVVIFYLFCTFVLNNSEREHAKRRFVLFLALIGFVCYIRPTAAPCISLYFLVFYFSSLRLSHKIILSAATTLIISSLLVLTDTLLYGKFTIPLWNFLHFNIVRDIASYYGTHPYHWYLTQCLPVFLLTNIPAFIIGTVLVIKNNIFIVNGAQIARIAIPGLILLNLGFLSPVPHKEFRYLLPMLPFCHFLAARGISAICENDDRKYANMLRKCLILLPLIQIPVSCYFGLIHQRGAIRVTEYLHGRLTEQDRVLFLIPCHSTPLYSHIHKNATLHFLECSNPSFEPVDRSEVFYRNASLQTDALLSEPAGYTHVVCFSVLSRQIREVLRRRGFVMKIAIFHTHIPEGRIGSHVHVYKYLR